MLFSSSNSILFYLQTIGTGYWIWNNTGLQILHHFLYITNFFFLIKHCLITCITGLINVKLEGREALLQTHLYKGYLTLYSYDEWKKLIVYAYSITQRGEGLGAHHHKYEDQNKIIDN